MPPLQLALGKSAVLAAASCAALGLAAARGASRGQPLAALWPGWRQPQGWGLILWSAMGPGALSTFLHIKVRAVPTPGKLGHQSPVTQPTWCLQAAPGIGALVCRCEGACGRAHALPARACSARLSSCMRRPGHANPHSLQGQSLLSPAAAQVVFASVPLWSALLAAVALPGEAVSRGTWLGGALIAVAGLVAALAQRRGAGGAPSASSSTRG